MKIFRLIIASLLLLNMCSAKSKCNKTDENPIASCQNSAAIPSTRNIWLEKHDWHKAWPDRESVELVFLGDSITEGWQWNDGMHVWSEYFGTINAANFGIGGDRTEHIIWRIQNDCFEGMSPKVVVVLAGTNNCGLNTASEIADGVAVIVKELNQRLPDSKILLMAIFPRGETPDDRDRKTCSEVNEIIAGLADGKKVHYLDIGADFLGENGKLSRDICPDLLHLSEKGYEIWARALKPEIDRLLQE